MILNYSWPFIDQLYECLANIEENVTGACVGLNQWGHIAKHTYNKNTTCFIQITLVASLGPLRELNLCVCTATGFNGGPVSYLGFISSVPDHKKSKPMSDI